MLSTGKFGDIILFRTLANVDRTTKVLLLDFTFNSFLNLFILTMTIINFIKIIKNFKWFFYLGWDHAGLIIQNY